MGRFAKIANGSTTGFLTLGALALVALACGADGTSEVATEKASEEASGAAIAARAAVLAQEILIVDTHIDVPYRLRRGDGGRLGAARRRATSTIRGPWRAASTLPFMSIYVPAELPGRGRRQRARRRADRHGRGLRGELARTSSPWRAASRTCAAGSSPTARSRCPWAWRTARRSRAISTTCALPRPRHPLHHADPLRRTTTSATRRTTTRRRGTG